MPLSVVTWDKLWLLCEKMMSAMAYTNISVMISNENLKRV